MIISVCVSIIKTIYYQDLIIQWNINFIVIIYNDL